MTSVVPSMQTVVKSMFLMSEQAKRLGIKVTGPKLNLRIEQGGSASLEIRARPNQPPHRVVALMKVDLKVKVDDESKAVIAEYLAEFGGLFEIVQSSGIEAGGEVPEHAAASILQQMNVFALDHAQFTIRKMGLTGVVLDAAAPYEAIQEQIEKKQAAKKPRAASKKAATKKLTK